MAPRKEWYNGTMGHETPGTKQEHGISSHYSHYTERLIMVRGCPACEELSKRLPAQGR